MLNFLKKILFRRDWESLGKQRADIASSIRFLQEDRRDMEKQFQEKEKELVERMGKIREDVLLEKEEFIKKNSKNISKLLDLKFIVGSNVWYIDKYSEEVSKGKILRISISTENGLDIQIHGNGSTKPEYIYNTKKDAIIGYNLFIDTKKISL